ncbi:hypothetical protein BJ684DRAFT_20830 [Piptocephalis cylindrospora]|uniref:CTLH/CRA C-terminal to LisH motif domain-containing protein n=1 Tax=Piptocephalis cylindrospora TaxID=1907219 RepID=A0A4P9Y1V8_9FUNG|nr:hypothetical protein BJ684DRAFT_20830 [Piptocephalis cylindrospora]|eukprot:RKP12644.1 hypothetical protein BJ684DRAFT_20830 [Piptocephalis cylindrospora]
MDVVQEVEEELRLLTQKQQKTADLTDARLKDMVASLLSAADTLTESKEKGLEVLGKLHADTKTMTTTLNSQHRDLYTSSGRYIKFLEKKFDGDLDVGYTGVLDNRLSTVREAVMVHLLSTGHFDLADQYTQDNSASIPSAQREGYKLLNSIVLALRGRNVLPALEWATEQATILETTAPPGQPSLLFQLHSLRYLQILQESVPQAIHYAQKHLAVWSKGQEVILRRLMCAALYTGGGSGSGSGSGRSLGLMGGKGVRRPKKYTRMGGSREWEDAERGIREGFCRVIGVAGESPLATTLSIGTLALPRILKMAKVKQVNKAEWTSNNELPVEIPPCPTPPTFTRLPCGHVVSSVSIQKLAKGPSAKVKCPYCPSQYFTTDTVRVYF